MNIYEKLQNVRVELAAEGLQKSGKNTYSNYTYFELSDFLPQANRLCQKYKLGHAMTMTDDGKQFVLTIVDIDDIESRLVFKLPYAAAELKAAHPVQNLGAVVTYSRKYLYMLAFDIVQNDTIEMTDRRNAQNNSVGGNNDNGSNANNGGNQKQNTGGEFVWNHSASPKDELERLWSFVNWNPADLPKYLEERAKKTGREINDTFYESIIYDNIRYMQEEAAKGNAAYKDFTFDTNEDLPFD